MEAWIVHGAAVLPYHSAKGGRKERVNREGTACMLTVQSSYSIYRLLVTWWPFISVHGIGYCDKFIVPQLQVTVIQGSSSPQIVWVDNDLWISTILPILPSRIGQMVEHLKSKSTQPNYPSGCPIL